MTTINVRHETLRIAGRRVDNQRRIEVRYPFTGELVGTVPKATLDDVRAAFRTAAAYQPTLTRYDRHRILQRTAELLLAHQEDISDLITLEAGISKKDSRYEVTRAYDVFMLSGLLCLQDDAEVFSCDITPNGQKRKIYTTRAPLRAIAAITPFNHPLNQVAHKIAPSIATNNCMVLKPSEKTPLTALLLADLLYEAGLPPEMFSVITGDPAEICDEMLTSEYSDMITFTGGVSIGKYIAAKAAYKRQLLELGGNDPLIVMEDADLERAATLAVNGATKNSGQRCTAVKRILVVESVADRFVELVTDKARAIRCGDPMSPDSDMGTVIDEEAARLFQRRVDDAIAAGAELKHGHQREGALYCPTVIDRVAPEAEVVLQETFGPVIPIIRCPNDIEAVIRISNSTAYGLSSGVCTDNLKYITRFIEGLEVGTVNVWEVPGYRIEMSPFGGIKDSGLGYKEGVLEAMKHYTNLKTYSLPW
ncbi:phosphonoacetaldehyde dehydrogenase [Marinobacterium nitratireducens]|uniref:Phosphonoacetaldehyde dehydrogenase n=1 Tax=Marinobacterium nitratireducens TaxID=518897 RepID=A0A918DMP6_9GAMM|nr:phosphonoacetaldehyde dehydrogenase [Marinobacterium nitratireducens]GGO75410.1 phosphonoacetaldehyde dehydrogenase [Marinobacterium nitratireducens]